MIKYLLLLILLITLNSCNESSMNDIRIDTKCIVNSDCLENEICEANYCVSNAIDTSKATFSLEFRPTNNINNNEYYHQLNTSIILGEELVKNSSFTLDVSNYIELSGEIKNNQNLNISYSVILYNEESGVKFYGHSYQENDKTLYHLKVPEGIYNLEIFPDKFYPTFNIEIGDLRGIAGNYNYNHDIIVDREIDPLNYYKLSGILNLKIDDSKYTPKEYTIHAYIDNNNSEKVISNKFTCNNDCDRFKLTILNIDDKKAYLKIKITVDTLKLENITFNIPIEDLEEPLENLEIDLGNFYESRGNKLIFNGNCTDDFKNIEIKIKGHLNNNAVYENKFICSNGVCDNLNLYEGSFNVFIKPNSDSCYVSKFSNIQLSKEQTEININLKNKKEVSGVLMSNSGLPVEGIISLRRKDNIFSDFKVITNSDPEGNFKVNLEPGEYNISIEPINSSISYSNWLYLNQRITVNTNSLLYIIPKSYKLPITLYAQGNTPVASAQVTMYLHNLEDIFSSENGYQLPENYKLYEYITDSFGKFVLSVPIIVD